MSERWTLGVDVGSVTVKFLLMDAAGEARHHSCRRTRGAPIEAMVAGLAEARAALAAGVEIGALGTTGSGRHLAAALLGADIVKNEITAHAVGTASWNPAVRTIMEIGGQDSKIIHLRDGLVDDFAMNTVCAAGTGAFLDQQATRLQISIEEFGAFALTARKPARIAGRCTVFAESDMIHKQQTGHAKADICMGLCQALVRNYLNNVARGRDLASPIAFQGGVASNQAIIHCFRQALPGSEIVIPPLTSCRGALGAALLAREGAGAGPTRFRGWQLGAVSVTLGTCAGCVNECEILTLLRDGAPSARLGGRCDRGNSLTQKLKDEVAPVAEVGKAGCAGG